MLTEGEAREFEAWMSTARRWCESAQEMVGAATELTNSSRELAELIAGGQDAARRSNGEEREMLGSDLRRLAQTIEDEGRALRDRFLATEADLDLYKELLD
jgi:hypothetical protein